MNNNGMSLLELIFCLLIVSIASLFSLPTMSAWQQKTALHIVKNQLQNAIVSARNFALISKQKIILAPLNKEDWSQGIGLFVMRNQQKELIYGYDTNSNIDIEWHGLQQKQLQFSLDPANAMLSGHFIIKNKTGQSVRLIINRVGRIVAREA